MESIKKQVELAISDDYKYKEDVLKDIETLLNDNKTMKKTLEASKENAPMSDEAIKLFMENYENKGLTKGLENFVKSFDKEFKKANTKKTIQYLPWAVVERIFRLQGGSIEVVDWKYAVTFDGLKDYNIETGEIDDNGSKSALFVHLRATWKGQTLDEFYPIFDNQTSRVVKSPDSQQLNTSRQRGSVRLIARLSGIGLWIFEQQDSQFEDDEKGEEVKIIVKNGGKEDVAETKEEKKTTSKKEKATSKKEEEKLEKDKAMEDALGGKVEKVEEEKPDENLANMFLGKVINNDEEPKQKPITQPTIPTGEKDYPKESEEHSDLLVKVKGFVKTHKDVILAFRNEKGKELLGDLSYLELKELLEKLEA